MGVCVCVELGAEHLPGLIFQIEEAKLHCLEALGTSWHLEFGTFLGIA